MKALSRIAVVALMAVAVVVVLSGCGGGVSPKKLDAADKRIQRLSQQGVPDSLLADAKLLLEQIKALKQYGGAEDPAKLYDSLMAMLAKFGSQQSATESQLQPTVTKMRKIFDLKLPALTGLQRKEADSLIAIVDSLIKNNLWPDAQRQCLLVDSALGRLSEDEQKAHEIKPKLVGTWVATQHDGNAVEKNVYTFSKDGKADVVEEKNGQSSDYLKEDWKFHSTGTWDVKGDRAMVELPHEQCLRQVYFNLVEKDGKSQWVKAEKPPYDSIITSGKRFREFCYDTLKAHYKKR